MTAPRVPNGSTPDGCVAAHVALERADHALAEVRDTRESLRSFYALLAGFRREIAGLREELRIAMQQIGVRLQTAEAKAGKAEEGVDDLEDTLVKDLRAELAEARGSADKWKWWLLGMLAAVISGVVAALIAAKLGVHL